MLGDENHKGATKLVVYRYKRVTHILWGQLRDDLERNEVDNTSLRVRLYERSLSSISHGYR